MVPVGICMVKSTVSLIPYFNYLLLIKEIPTLYGESKKIKKAGVIVPYLLIRTTKCWGAL
jgi:hypothetical protein